LAAVSLRTRAAAQDVLAGRRRGFGAVLPFLGPAFIASVAYMDPGNFATNISSGAKYGYRLLWVVLFANATAMLFQYLSAKLGIVTGRNLAEMCREQFPRPVAVAMWLLSEVVAMATDLAEFLGATLAISLLLHLPMLVSVVIAGLATWVLLMLDRFGFRPVEALIGALVAVIGLAYLAEIVMARPDLRQALGGTFVPSFDGAGSVLLAVGIIGATVMPHALFIHSGLTQHRIVPKNATQARRIVRFESIDVVIALGIAGLINMSMLAMAASAFHGAGQGSVGDLTTAYKTLTPLLGPAAGVTFLVALLASGLSSSTVGTMAGQVIMQGFVGFTIPLWVRRLVTMAPAVVVIGLGADPTMSLVISQVVLSLVLPVPILSLILFTRRRDIMGELVNSRLVTSAAGAASALILALNLVLLVSTAGLPIPLLD
jgi:manganese transport protein